MSSHLGQCVYCGSREPPLTDEHVIPKGLGGTDMLEAATCEDCRLQIGKYETPAINSMTWLLRVALDVRGLKGKHPQIRHKITDDNEISFVTKSPLNALPITGMLPAFKRARLLRGDPIPNEFEDFDLVVIGNTSRRPRANQLFDLDIRSYARMLCKIAHCYTVQSIGIEFKPLLTNVIIDGASDWANFLGSDAQPFPKDESKLHKLELLTNDGGLLFVRLQLFSNIGAPVYHVITGQLADSGDVPHPSPR